MKKLSSAFLMIAALCFCKSNFLTAQVNVQDSLALVALYNNTDGPNWNKHTNWITNNPVSSWFGITVKNDRVSAVQIKYNNLKGNIPHEIGNLTALENLTLYNNHLNGNIPSEIGNLTNLNFLNLQNNHLGGNIPAEIGNLNHLVNVNLSNNKLTGIPAEMGNLFRLERLTLNDNQLSGNIPGSLGNLLKLQNLYLNNNQLTGNIPFELGNLSNLVVLYMDNNQLTGSIPSELGNLLKLSYLHLNNNQLSGNIPASFGNLREIVNFNLAYNQLTDNIPDELGNLGDSIGSNDYLDVYLNNNKLTGSIPSEIKNLSHNHLQYLDLSYNRLTGRIPDSLRALKVLHFNHNRLSGHIPSTISSMSIDLSYNRLSGELPALTFSPNFYQEIILNNNRLSGQVIPLYERIHPQILRLDSNNFVFSGMVNLVRNFYTFGGSTLNYSPQAIIPIHRNGNALSVYTGGSYQLTLDTFKWYKNGTLAATIIGDSNFVAGEDGVYNVVVTNSVATKLTLYSDTINYAAGNNLTASKMNNNSSISIYPNPAKNYATLLLNADGKYSIIITDVSGRILQTKTGVANKSTNVVQLDVSKYASGVYLITVVDERNKKQTVRLNKE